MFIFSKPPTIFLKAKTKNSVIVDLHSLRENPQLIFYEISWFGLKSLVTNLVSKELS